MRLSIFIIMFLFFVGFFCQAQGEDSTMSKNKNNGAYVTVIQTATPYDARSNIQVDLAFVAAAESIESILDIPLRVNSWRDKGCRVFGFASVERVYDYYMKGGWIDLDGKVDEGNHEGEIQRNRYGGKFGPHQYMMMPTLRIADHKKLWAKAFIDVKTEGMYFEEPDCFMDGGYDDSFKKEWQDYYKEPWSPPYSSIENRVKSERLKAYMGYRNYKILADYCRSYGGNNYKFGVAVHSLPNYLLWGVNFAYWDTMSLPTVDILNAQVWTGTAKTRILYEGEMVRRMFDNAFFDYSYCNNLVEALGKDVIFNMDPFEDEWGHSSEFYKNGFENTLVASLMHPQVNKWQILPWPNRIYQNDRISPLYGTELQNVLTCMTDIAKNKENYSWNKRFPKTGLLFSDSVLFEVRDPLPSNPQALFALSLPLLSMGLPLDIVSLEAVNNEKYIDQFKILLLSYDFYKPMKPEYHQALLNWVKNNGGTLIVFGGENAYNKAPFWWQKEGYESPTAHLLEVLGIGSKNTKLIMQQKQDIKLSPSPENKSLADSTGNFWSELLGADYIPRPVEFITNDSFPDSNYLYEHIPPGYVIKKLRFPDGKIADIRYADCSGHYMYKFRTDCLDGLNVYADIAHNYIIEASSDKESWTELESSSKLLNQEVRDESNRHIAKLDLTPWIKKGAESVFIRFRDPSSSDGWGPLIYSMRLEPTYKAGFNPPSIETIPLNTRDSYVTAYSSVSSDIKPVIIGKDNNPIVFIKQIGNGEVIVCGFSATLPGMSSTGANILRALYREVCKRKNEAFDEDGIFHLTRDKYHIVYPITEELQLNGYYVDILSTGLDVLKDPLLAIGDPRILLQMENLESKKSPSLIFASHRLKDVKQGNNALSFAIEGPESIPVVARIFCPDRDKYDIIITRNRDRVVIEYSKSYDEESKTLYLLFNTYEKGVKIEVRPKL